MSKREMYQDRIDDLENDLKELLEKWLGNLDYYKHHKNLNNGHYDEPYWEGSLDTGISYYSQLASILSRYSDLNTPNSNRNDPASDENEKNDSNYDKK